MKKISMALLAATTFIFYACNDGEKTSTNETTTTNAGTDSTMASDNTRNKMTTDTSKMSGAMNNSATADFVNKAATGGMMEVEGAKIARMNAASAEVKNFAKMIEEDHTKANNELKSICAKKKMTPPTELMGDEKSHLDEMRKMKGKDMDKHYIDMMVEDHQKDIEEFKNAANTLTDPELKEYAMKTLPTLQKHLDKAKELQKGE